MMGAQMIQILAARERGTQYRLAVAISKVLSSMRNIAAVDVLIDIATCCGFDPAEARAIALRAPR
ncbi:DSBA oxidoreductase (fragment) [Mesorhizobium sp. ORS 3359]